MNKIALILLFCFSLSTFNVYADNLDSYKNKLNNINKNINNINKELKQNKSAQRSVVEKINDINSQITQRENQIVDIQSNINTTTTQVVFISGEVNKLNDKIKNNQAMLGKRLRVMYKTSDIGYMEVLFASKNVTEFLSNLDMIKRIVTYDKNLLAVLGDNKKQVEQKKNDLQNKQKKMITLKNDMQTEQTKLQATKVEQAELKKQLEEDQEELESDLDEMNKFAQSISQEILKLQSKGSYTGGIMAWPVPGYSKINSPFGNRFHPIFKKNKMHTGIDIPAPTGTNIVAANNGRVIKAEYYGGYGNAVIIDHGGGIATLYGHNSRLLVSVGQTVQRGQVIAKAGSTGNSTGPHCHFEVRKNGQFVDPVPWVK